MKRAALTFAVASVLTAACGKGASTPRCEGACDAGPPMISDAEPMPGIDAGTSSISPPKPPEIARLPALLPCPIGWRELTSTSTAEPSTCAPWPTDQPKACPADAVELPGDPDCTPIGTACPIGRFADGLPADRPILFVDPAAMTQGTGTSTSPFSTLARAFAAAQPGAVIALARGQDAESIAVPASITILGACPAETKLSGALTIAGVNVTIENARITGPAASLSATQAGTTLILRDVVFEDTAWPAIAVSGEVSLDAERIAVVRTSTRSTDTHGIASGLIVRDGARAMLVHAWFDRNVAAALVASGALATITLTDSIVRRTDASSGGLGGEGIAASAGGVVEVRRSVLEESLSTEVFATGGTTRASLADVLIRRTRGAADRSGIAMAARDGAEIRAERTIAEETFAGAFYAVDQGTSVQLADVVVRNVRPFSGAFGSAVYTSSRATGHLERVLAESPFLAGVVVDGAGTTLVGTDLTIRDTRPDGPKGGSALAITAGAQATISRARFERNTEIGLFVRDQSSFLRIEDLVVADTRQESGKLGGAIGVQLSGQIDLERALLARNHDTAIVSLDPGSLVHAKDLAIAATDGDGASVFGLGALELERFSISESTGCGLSVDILGCLEVKEGMVTNGRYGLCVPTSSTSRWYGLTQNDVSYSGNVEERHER